MYIYSLIKHNYADARVQLGVKRKCRGYKEVEAYTPTPPPHFFLASKITLMLAYFITTFLFAS